MIIEQLKTKLEQDDVRGIARSSDGTVVTFHNGGVLDLFNLLNDSPGFLDGGILADRVIGRGAALLLIKGKVAQVYAKLISCPALNVLLHAGVDVCYDQQVPNIINRMGNGICPVEQLTINVDDPNEAFSKIRNFLTK